MPLQLAYMEEKDIPEFAAVDAATAEGWAFVQAMDLSGQPRHVFAEQWARSVWGKSDMEHWLKVTDTESGEMVAMALWRLQLEEEMPKEELPAPAETVAPETKGESNAVDPRTARFWADTARAGKAFQDEFIGTRPHAYLQILITHPQHQRRGAGSMLVKWGCDKADDHSIICAVQASKAGTAVYTKHGFKIVKEREVDLRPYGVDETELRRSMIRESKLKPKQASE